MKKGWLVVTFEKPVKKEEPSLKAKKVRRIQRRAEGITGATMSTISRRDFLKVGGAAATALAVGQFIPAPVAQAARDAGHLNAQGDGEIATMCEMCVWRCGVLAKVVNGRVVKLDGNPDHPHSNGKLCPRGQAGLMNTYDPDRVLTPLIRVGKRGEGKFRKASWEEALDLVAWNMLEIKDKYGPEAMVFSSTHNLSRCSSRICCRLRLAELRHAALAVLQCHDRRQPDDLSAWKSLGAVTTGVKYILLTGRNLIEAISTSETGELIHAIDRGAKMVYLDPRFTKTAAKATEWLPIRPALIWPSIWR